MGQTTVYAVCGTDMSGGVTEYNSAREACVAAARRINANVFRGETMIARTVRRVVYTACREHVYNGREGYVSAYIVLPVGDVELTDDERRVLCPKG
jgi:hypothetical protein